MFFLHSIGGAGFRQAVSPAGPFRVLPEFLCDPSAWKLCGKRRERRQRTAEYTVHFRYGDAIVRDADSRRRAERQPSREFLFVEHTPAAMYNQSKPRKILWEFTAGGEAEAKLLTRVFFQPGGQLDGADIPALAMVGAALADKYGVAVFKTIDRIAPSNELFEIPPVPCEKN